MAAKKVKILITVDSLNAGGTERQVIELVKGFHNNNNFDVSVLTLTANGHYDKIVKPFTTLYTLTNKPADWKRISSFNQLYQIIKNNRFDIVQTMSLEDSLMIYILSNFLDFKWINGSVRDADARRGRRQWQKRFLLKRARFIIANSHAGLRTYNVSQNRCARVIYNGVDPNRFIIKNLNTNDKSTNEIRLCSVANLSNYKDYFTLIESIELLKELPISLHIFGDGPMRETFEAMVKLKNLQSKITFYGRVTNVESFLPTMDCGVLMSFRKSGEGLPNAILEFLSSGVPVIASNVGGVSEVIKNDVNGILVEPENSFSLTQAIKKIVKDKNYLFSLSKNTTYLIQKQFTLGRMIDDYERYYTEVVHE